MIVSGNKANPRAVFVHVNKTAGTSIHRALGIECSTHFTVRDFQQQLGSQCWTQLFSFAFVRNPWDRAVSQYLWRIATNQTEMAVSAPSFREWIHLTLEKNDSFYYDQPKMFMPQRQWLVGESGAIEISFIGRFERLQDDFDEVVKILDIKTPSLPHLKKTDREPYRNYYDSDTRKIVETWFAEDIESLGYSF